MRKSIIFWIILLGAFHAQVRASDAPETCVTRDDYVRLQGWQFSLISKAVPSEGITFTKDTATWTLQNGKISLMEPAADGTVTGLVFEGQGRFIMTIPDRFEVEQLRRFSEKPDIEKLDTPFARMVLRTSSKMLAPYAADMFSGGLEKNGNAKERHEKWLRIASLDVDARIIAGLLIAGDDYLLVDVDTQDFGWLMFEYDPFSQEEIKLTKLQKQNDFPEIWISLDRPEERDSRGRPTSTKRQFVDVTYVAIQVNLMDTSSKTFDPRDPDRAWIHFHVELTFTSLVEGARALQLYLNPLARVKSVAKKDGTSVPFLRDATGRRFASMDNELNNGALVLLLDQPTQKGVSQDLEFEYDMKLYNYASGRDWYPCEAEVLSDVHTGQLSFTMPEKYQVRAVGVPEEVMESSNNQVAVWNVTKPIKMFGFSFGKGFSDEKINVANIPEIDSFGTESGLTTGNMVRNVAADIANSLNFYQQYYGVKIPSERIYAARIMGFHGQAFEGFIHLSYLTYDAEHPGFSELFRAHETAHLYWGHLVGWKTYRDQWISEAFAEYSAMMFLQASMKGGKAFQDILSEYTDDLTGMSKSMVNFALRSLGYVPTAKQRRRVGPIAAGYRASTAQVPDGYSLQSYRKGALVLHMIRQILSAASRDHDAFRETLQDFLRTYSGREAGTQDFMRMLQKHTNMDWTQFFENWIYGTSVPTYTWSYAVANSPDNEGKYPFSLKVKQTDVPPDFAAIVPVYFDYGQNKWGYIWVQVDRPERTFSHLLPAKPKKVIFNPGYSVLAIAKKEG